MVSILSQRIRSVVSRGAKDTNGTATVEAVIWLPFIFAFFGVIVDVSLVFHGRSQAYRVMQDANRARSTGRYDDAQTAAYVVNTLSTLSPNATAATQMDLDTGVVTTKVMLPTPDLMAVGIFDLFKVKMHLSSSHLVEYY